MVVVYKYSDLFEDGKLVGEIFTEYPVGDLFQSSGIVATLKKEGVEIENRGIQYSDTSFGLIFTNRLVDCLDDVFDLWNKRRKDMAGWISRGSFHTGLIGCEYSKPGSDDWVFIEGKHISEKDIRKVSKNENVDGFHMVEEEYIDDELVSESFKLFDGTILKLERSEIGFKKDNRGVILREYEVDVFNEFIGLWKKRRSKYEI